MRQILFKLFWWVSYKKIQTTHMECCDCCFKDDSFCDDYSTYCEPEDDKHFIYKKR